MPKGIEKRAIFLLPLIAGACTLAITPWLNWDPINLGKVLIISSGSFYLFFLLVSTTSFRGTLIGEKSFYPFALFFLCLFLPLFLTDAPFSQQFWGVMGRNTGFLTYFSLALIAFVASSILNSELRKRVIAGLVITGVVLIPYGIAQVLDSDPIGWSQFAVFGTLGNVNFFAAFLGIVFTALFSLMISGFTSHSFMRKFGFLSLLCVIFWLNLKTDSMQGPVTAAVGSYFALWIIFFQRNLRRKLWLAIGFVLTTLVVAFPIILGLFGKGPLSQTMFQDSNVFRKDYMLAGWRMTVAHPLTGIGLDSYDSYYRAMRGFVAAFRTGPNRTSNSAHNVWLDLSSGGGLPLLVAYLSILTLAIVLALRVLRFSKTLDKYYVALLACFFAYHFQSLLSINQVGIGVWGWVLTGTLIGSSKQILSEINGMANIEKKDQVRKNYRDKKKNSKSKTGASNYSVPAISALIGIVGLVVGFVLAYLPLSTDASFRKAMNSGNLGAIVQAVSRVGVNSFMLAKAVQAAIDAKNFEVANNLTKQLTQRFPREIYGWDVASRSTSLSVPEREKAKTELLTIDPNFLCFNSNPSQVFLDKFNSMSVSNQGELLSWWGLTPRQGARFEQIESAKKSEIFTNRVATICG